MKIGFLYFSLLILTFEYNFKYGIFSFTQLQQEINKKVNRNDFLMSKIYILLKLQLGF